MVGALIGHANTGDTSAYRVALGHGLSVCLTLLLLSLLFALIDLARIHLAHGRVRGAV